MREAWKGRTPDVSQHTRSTRTYVRTLTVYIYILASSRAFIIGRLLCHYHDFCHGAAQSRLQQFRKQAMNDVRDTTDVWRKTSKLKFKKIRSLEGFVSDCSRIFWK